MQQKQQQHHKLVHQKASTHRTQLTRTCDGMSMILVSLLLILSCASGEKLWTLCSTEISGSTAKIVCLFSEDLSRTGSASAVFVQRYSFNESDPRTVDVAHCYLQKGKCNNFNASNGYRVSHEISTTFTVTIEPLKPEHEGRYHCQLRGRDADIDNQKEFCNLKRSKSEDRQATAGSTSTTAPDMKLDSSKPSENPALIAAAVVGAVFGVFATMMFLICHVRRSLYKQCLPHFKGKSHQQQRSVDGLTESSVPLKRDVDGNGDV